ncbi:MAG: hypothetical protein ACRDBF_07180 [Plesiomonas shigelloides]
MHIDDAVIDRMMLQFSELGSNTIKLAYHRAMRRTEATIRKQALGLMSSRLGLRGTQRRLKRRVQAYMRPGEDSAELKFWFGLNDLDPMLFKGGVRKAAGGLMIRGTYYERAFVAVIQNRRGAWQRKGAERTPLVKLRVPIDDEITIALEDEVFVNLPDIFMRHFETDLRGRSKSSSWKSAFSDKSLSSAVTSIADW